jgi:phage tail sheath protein FI
MGGWSSTLVVAIPAPDRWLTIPAAAYDGASLLATQLAALRMCVARGDMLAVLALPEHYRARDATAHIQALRASEPDACGYGALYHPWLWVTNAASPGVVTPAAPDGTAIGVIAGRSYDRGPWIAPANQPLTGVVALDPPFPRADRQTLLDDQLNEVRDDAGGFRWLAADTLTDDVDVRPIGVRRLLQALSRYMILRGARYVFEPDSEAFRRAVEHDLEDLLTGIWELGAFAGATPSDGFRVSTGSPPNTPAGIDAGQLIVEVGVAPSLPLAFLTVRLIRGADGALTTQAS